MSRTQVVEVRCDLCGHGGPWSDPATFQRVGGFDFCRWCADDQPKQWAETGSHRVTFGQDGVPWVCSCGKAYNTVVMWLRMRGVRSAVFDAVPDAVLATASAHLNAPEIGY